ncbi:MAG: hypothetical protein CBE14_000695 [Rickettsiales bacterium TMED254]|nr:MAG: hypothetical protein CBE14_000695 [Rickettsiales bacterium TMED254]|tara:strand:- start:328 stop:543 length:216 start_codon:yes stop_codon:yes gene_type:complete
MNIQPKDPSYNHFAVSLVKSIFRIVAGGLLAWAGYMIWSANNFDANSGFLIMLSGTGFILAEALGIIEEIV